MDYSEKKYLKEFKPKPDRLYFHPGSLDSDYWSCCGKVGRCYLGRRGCKWIGTNWGKRKSLVVVYQREKELGGKVGRLPLSLLKEVISYI